MVGGVLDACERLVDHERLSHALSELRAHIVISQTTNKSQKGVYQRKGCQRLLTVGFEAWGSVLEH